MVLFGLARDGRYATTIILPTHNPLENNQAHIVQDMLAGEYDFWLSIDSDNPPKRNPLDLVELDLDIVGFPTPVWHYTGKSGERPYYWNAYRAVPDGYKEWDKKDGLQQVDAVGGGCWLIARRVLERLPAPQFARKLNDDGTVDRGNDISFCERARAAGFSIWTHFDYPCMHFNELELTEVIRAFIDMRP